MERAHRAALGGLDLELPQGHFRRTTTIAHHGFQCARRGGKHRGAGCELRARLRVQANTARASGASRSAL